MTRKNLRSGGSYLSNGPQPAKGNQLVQQFKSGDVAWIKTRGFSWWPCQVVDEGSVNCKSKKKGKDEVLVRIYGTSEYLFVDLILRQKNISIREAFLITLEETLSRVKSGVNSRRKVSESKENAIAGAPKGKSPKHDRIEKFQEADTSCPGASSVKQKEVRSDERKEMVYAMDKASGNKKDVSHVKFGGNSKRKVPESRENPLADVPKAKNQKQDKTERNQKADILPFPGASAGKSKDVRLGERKKLSDTMDKASRNKKAEKGDARKMEETRSKGRASNDQNVMQDGAGKPNKIEKVSNGASKTKVMKQDVSEKAEHKNVKGKVTERATNSAPEDKNAKHDGAGNPNVKAKARTGASKINDKERDALEKLKQEDVVEQLTRNARDESKGKTAKQDWEGKPEKSEKTRSRTSRLKEREQKDSRKMEHNNAKEQITSKVGDEASRGKTVKQGREGKANSTRTPNHEIDMEHCKTESPSSAKNKAPEETTTDLSTRRTKVMQSLGLIAPLGSPFR